MNKFDKYLVDLGNKIRLLRNEKGVNQKLFAANVGIDDRHLRRIEKGKTNPSIEVIYLIALELDLTPSELLLNVSNTK